MKTIGYSGIRVESTESRLGRLVAVALACGTVACILVVVLSPEAAQSYWVNQEVSYWLQRGGRERLLLVLAGVHHRVRFEGREEPNGETFVDLPDLQEHYEKETGRDFPSPGDFRSLMTKFKRWGIAAFEDKDDVRNQLAKVRIHPAIGDLLRKEYLSHLESFRKEVAGEGDAATFDAMNEVTEDGDVSA